MKTTQLNIRIEPGDLEILLRNAADYGASIGRPVSVSEYIRVMILRLPKKKRER